MLLDLRFLYQRAALPTRAGLRQPLSAVLQAVGRARFRAQFVARFITAPQVGAAPSITLSPSRTVSLTVVSRLPSRSRQPFLARFITAPEIAPAAPITTSPSRSVSLNVVSQIVNRENVLARLGFALPFAPRFILAPQVGAITITPVDPEEGRRRGAHRRRRGTGRLDREAIWMLFEVGEISEEELLVMLANN